MNTRYKITVSYRGGHQVIHNTDNDTTYESLIAAIDRWQNGSLFFRKAVFRLPGEPIDVAIVLSGIVCVSCESIPSADIQNRRPFD